MYFEYVYCYKFGIIRSQYPNNLRTVRARQGLANLFFVKKFKFDYIPGEIQNRHESAYKEKGNCAYCLVHQPTRVIIIKWSSPLTLYFTQNFVAFSCSLTCCELLSIQIVKLLSCRYLKSLFESPHLWPCWWRHGRQCSGHFCHCGRQNLYKVHWTSSGSRADIRWIWDCHQDPFSFCSPNGNWNSVNMLILL